MAISQKLQEHNFKLRQVIDLDDANFKQQATIVLTELFFALSELEEYVMKIDEWATEHDPELKKKSEELKREKENTQEETKEA